MAKSIYPSIPSPGNDAASQRATLDAMRQSLTMMIMNAQAPNPNFSPSASSQVFVTYDALKKMNVSGVQGAPGQKGDQGLTGPAGQPGAPGPPGADFGSVPVFTPLPPNAANDAAAATAGVPVNGVYRNGSILMVRVV